MTASKNVRKGGVECHMTQTVVRTSLDLIVDLVFICKHDMIVSFGRTLILRERHHTELSSIKGYPSTSVTVASL